MPKPISIEGITTPSGQEWFKVTMGDRVGWVRRREFHGSAKEAIDHLRDQNIIIIGQAHVRALIERAAGVVQFPPGEVVEDIGWNGSHFALPDGSVFSPDGVRPPEVIFDPILGRCSERGTLKKWKRKVAKPLKNQAVAVFALSMAFAPPLLKLTDRVGNYGFEVVGDGGTGKSLLQQLVSSVLGGAIQGADGHYWMTFNTTDNALEQALVGFSDLPLVLEEANLYFGGQTTKARGDHFKALAFRLGAGSQKARMGGGPPKEFRFIFLSSSNEPLAQLVEGDETAARAAQDRLITIPISSGTRSGVLDHVPDQFRSMSDFTNSLKTAADLNHGKAIRCFLNALVQDRSRDEGELRRKIGEWILEFHDRAGVDRDSGSAVRVADAFGLVYAAGQLAREYGALPQAFRPGRAALACYNLYLANSTLLPPFADRLNEIAGRDDVIDLGGTRRPQISARDRKRAVAFIRSRSSGRELWVRSQNIERLFPDWRRLSGRAEVLSCLKREDRHMKVKRTIGPGGKQDRVFCFRLTEG